MATVNQTGNAAEHRPVTNIQAHVIADDKGGGLTYRLAPGDEPSRQFVTGERKIDIPHSADLFKINFHLVDRDSSRKLVFDDQMPICAHNGTICPMSGGIQTDQLRQDGPPQNKKLTIKNCNSAQGPVSFTLFFRDEQTGQPVQEFDPIVDNGGGGGPSFD
jgi:hypothetical protein